MNLENRVEFDRELIGMLPDEVKHDASVYLQRIYDALPSCKQDINYTECMRKKLTIVKDKVLAKYAGK